MTSPSISSNKNLRIGILGGTFDPIHKGHIEPAKEVLKAFSLDKVFVIPAHKPPHKKSTNASTIHRVKMVELVCNKEPNFELDTREVERSSLSYTIDTINEINAQYPQSELFFIMGMDSLQSFTRWHLWKNILSQCNLVVNTRPGYDRSNINTDTQNLLNKHQALISDIEKPLKSIKDKLTGTIFIHHSKNVNISSTEIREHLNNKIACEKWLTSGIIQYIERHKLYLYQSK
jgi:nicotinate-nucleotide adenylyltransferase